MTTTPPAPGNRSADDFVSTGELIRRQGAQPTASVEEDLATAEDPFETDEEFADFLADLYATRSAGMG